MFWFLFTDTASLEASSNSPETVNIPLINNRNDAGVDMIEEDVVSSKASAMCGGNTNEPSINKPDDLENEIIEEDMETAASDDIEKLQLLQRKIMELDQQLTQEKSRSQIWLSLYMSEKNSEHTSADFFTCLSFILPTVNVTEFNLYVHQLPGDVTHSLYRHWQFVEQIVLDTPFANLMRQKWAEFSQHAGNSSSTKLPKRARKIYKDIKKSIQQKWEKFRESAKQYENAEPLQSVINNEKFQSIVNRTKETVSQLSEKIHSTWHRVKNLSTDILGNNEAMHTLKKNVVNKVSDIKDKVSKNWNEIKQELDKGWIRKKMVDRKSQYENHPQDHHSNSPVSGQDDVQQEDFTASALPKQSFSNKADHKQTQASTLVEKYEEFWKRANFDPDDYVHEDFFEGNQREWKKQQKRFRKLYGRILQLNEDMFYSMDDDDVEDMWEDIDDFQDDIEVDEQPEKLKNWLVCQVRWWKSRFQRKHRSEDFIKGCGAQLMRWQLRAQCKPICKGKKCKHVVTNPAACQYLYTQTVIVASEQAAAENKQCSQVAARDHSQTMQVEETTHILNDTVSTDAITDNDPASWYFNRANSLLETKPVIEDSGDNKKSATVLEARILEEAMYKKSQWLFDRALEREYHRQKTDWLFRRANKRQFEREKPWYYKRADNRYQMHTERQARGYA